MPTTDDLVAAFLAKGGAVTRVQEGYSKLEEDKQALRLRKAQARANREARMQRLEDQAEYEATCREAARF